MRPTTAASNVARPSLRTAPTAYEPASPQARRPPSSARTRISTRRTPSTKMSGPDGPATGTMACDQSAVSMVGSTWISVPSPAARAASTSPP